MRLNQILQYKRFYVDELEKIKILAISNFRVKYE